MSAILFKHSALGLAACCLLMQGVRLLRADSKHDYPEIGTVISIVNDRGNLYKIETADKVYAVECSKVRLFDTAPPACEVAGRPMAVNDTVQFRFDPFDAESAYIPLNGNHEEKLVVLSTELKVLPPLAPAAGPSAGESCAVLGNGKLLYRYQSKFQTSNAQSGESSGPVLAVPVTGGPPVQVISTGGSAGGVITGVPVTGGAPITAVPIEPTPAASRPSTRTTTINQSEWVHFLRVQTANRVYTLDCQSGPCLLKDEAPRLGILLTIRVKGNDAYLSWPPPGPKGEQKFKIMSQRDVDDPGATALH